MAKQEKKRLGKKHRRPETRPHLGKTPKSAKSNVKETAVSSPKNRKAIATKKAKDAAKKLTSKQAPEFERKRAVAPTGAQMGQTRKQKAQHHPASPAKPKGEIASRAMERLARGGHTVRVLVSYGSYWFPWYMRRLAERPANVLFVAKSLVRS